MLQNWSSFKGNLFIKNPKEYAHENTVWRSVVAAQVWNCSEQIFAHKRSISEWKTSIDYIVWEIGKKITPTTKPRNRIPI